MLKMIRVGNTYHETITKKQLFNPVFVAETLRREIYPCQSVG